MLQTERVFKIFKLLFKGNEVCTKKIAEMFSVDIRTAQRDLKYIKKFFQKALFQTKKGCYKILTSQDLAVYKEEDFDKIEGFFKFLALFDNNFQNIFPNQTKPVIKKLIKNTKRIYHIHEFPIEEMKNKKILENIEHAIKYKRYLNIEYFETRRLDLEKIKPLKIVFAQGNWYLASMTNYYKFNKGFKFFRINFITKTKILSETFKTDKEALEFIKNFQSLFQDYQKEPYKVILRVSKEAERYFRVKKFLKSQKEYPQKNGDLIVTYLINNDMEIIPLIKKYLPLVKVLEPVSLREKIKKDIKKFLDDE